MAMAVFQYNFIYKNNQIWPMGSSLLTIALHHSYFLSYTKNYDKQHCCPYRTLERNSTSSVMLRFHLSNWEVFVPIPLHQLKKKKTTEKITDSSFQDSHLSPHLYVCFLSNFLAWHGFNSLLICGVMLGKEGASLQLIPLSLIINS